MTKDPRLPPGAAADDDAPVPARLLATHQASWRVGTRRPPSRLVVGAAPPSGMMALEANLDRMRLDEDDEDTPPTAVPGAMRFALDWAEDDEDAAPARPRVVAPPVPPEDDVAAADAEAAVAPTGDTTPPAPAPARPAPAATGPVPPIAASRRAVPTWVWLLVGLAVSGGAAWLLAQ